MIQKPSPQTPLVAERFQEFYEKAGLPPGLLQTIHLGTLPELESLVARPEISHVAFTGSVAGGAAIQKAAVNSFKGNKILAGINVFRSVFGIGWERRGLYPCGRRCGLQCS